MASAEAFRFQKKNSFEEPADGWLRAMIALPPRVTTVFFRTLQVTWR